MRKSTDQILLITLLSFFLSNPSVYLGQSDSNAVFLFDTASASAEIVKPGSVGVSGSDQILNLIDFYSVYTNEKPQIQGYRIEIFSESGSGSRNKARKVQSKFEENFTDIPGYVKWQYPNFEVRVGDFRTKLEAEKNLAAIKEVFPFAYIKQDMIEPPVLEQRKKETLKGK